MFLFFNPEKITSRAEFYRKEQQKILHFQSIVVFWAGKTGSKGIVMQKGMDARNIGKINAWKPRLRK